MSEEIVLGDLEIGLGDVSPAWCEPENEKKTMDSDLAIAIVKWVNIALREKLAKAITVFRPGESGILGWQERPNFNLSSNNISGKDTHTARLVCLKEVR